MDTNKDQKMEVCLGQFCFPSRNWIHNRPEYQTESSWFLQLDEFEKLLQQLFEMKSLFTGYEASSIFVNNPAMILFCPFFKVYFTLEGKYLEFIFDFHIWSQCHWVRKNHSTYLFLCRYYCMLDLICNITNQSCIDLIVLKLLWTQNVSRVWTKCPSSNFIACFPFTPRHMFLLTVTAR